MGCLGAPDYSMTMNHEMVSTDLGDVAKRSIGSPNWKYFLIVMNWKYALKQSIEEEARTSLLQAVDEVFYWGGGMWLEDGAEMAMDDAGQRSSDTAADTSRRS